MEHGRFRNWLSHYPDAGLLIACLDGSGYQLCVEADGEMQCLTDSGGPADLCLPRAGRGISAHASGSSGETSDL